MTPFTRCLHTVSIFALLAMSGCATTGSTPLTLGEALQKGAHKLSKSEATQTVSGKSLSLLVPSGAALADLTFNLDGSLDGSVKLVAGPKAGATSRISGNWSIDDTGRLCLDETLVDWKQKQSPCQYLFALGHQIAIADSDTDVNAKITVKSRSDFK